MTNYSNLSRKTDSKALKAQHKSFQCQLNESDLMPVFEIEVTDKNGNQEFILCDISVLHGRLVAHRDGVSTEENNSNWVANTEIEIDEHHALDSHLEALHEAVLLDIISGDLYNLA